MQLDPDTLFAGDYRIVRKLSEGGMGSVYVAVQLSTGKERALKLMLPELVCDPQLRKRFEQEARVGSRIESEHVIEVVGAGVDGATQLPWLAMELLRGETLAEFVGRVGPTPVPTALTIMEQLCHAVAAAHAAGVVHRDLKPENIFLSEAKRAGAGLMVKVLDFGIAKIAADAQKTATAAIGSPRWMAPEQTTRGGTIAPTTDVWSIGLIAFYVMTGGHFWRSAEDDQTGLGPLLREMVLDPIATASERAAEIGTELPTGFDGWFARAVDRDPSRRFPNAKEAYHELAAALGVDGIRHGLRLTVDPLRVESASTRTGQTSRTIEGQPIELGPASADRTVLVDKIVIPQARPPRERAGRRDWQTTLAGVLGSGLVGVVTLMTVDSFGRSGFFDRDDWKYTAGAECSYVLYSVNKAQAEFKEIGDDPRQLEDHAKKVETRAKYLGEFEITDPDLKKYVNDYRTMLMNMAGALRDAVSAGLTVEVEERFDRVAASEDELVKRINAHCDDHGSTDPRNAGAARSLADWFTASAPLQPESAKSVAISASAPPANGLTNPTCLSYLEKTKACIAQAPDTEREEPTKAINEIEKMWNELSKTADGRRRLETSCGAALKQFEETGSCPTEAPAADVLPEMAAYLKQLDGSDDGAAKALEKVAKPGLDAKELGDYTLREPKLLKVDKKSDKMTCYDFEAKAGMMVDTFTGVCWEGGKIVSVAGHERR